MIACDTSFLIGRFVWEPHHERAKTLLLETESPLFISRLNELELETVIRRMIGRGQLTEDEAQRVLSEFRRHIILGTFELVVADDAVVWDRAMGLARHHAATLAVRTLDIWQVAYALEMRARTFWSFDDRQRSLAEAVGLKINRL